MPQILLRASTSAWISSAQSSSADVPLSCAVFLNPSLATQDDYQHLLRRFQDQHRHWARQVEYLRHANLIIGNKNQCFGIGVEVPASLLPQLLEILSTTPLSSASHVQLVNKTTEELVANHAKKHLRINPTASSLIAAYERG